MLKINRQALYRRLEGSSLMGYSDITDQELDSIICSHQSTHTNDGENMITGCLVSLGIHLQRRRIRKSIHIVEFKKELLLQSDEGDTMPIYQIQFGTWIGTTN